MNVNQFDTLTEALTNMRSRGFVLDFNLAENHLSCTEFNLQLNPNDFEVVEYHRFEGESDPADMAIVYGIKATDGHLGVLVNGYGTYSETVSSELIKKLAVPESHM